MSSKILQTEIHRPSMKAIGTVVFSV